MQKEGIELFGEQALAAMFKEFKQLDSGAVFGKPVLAPFDVDKVETSVRRATFEAVNFIKEKRDGNIKGWTCVNESLQHKYLKEDETVASPTVSLETILTLSVTAAF